MKKLLIIEETMFRSYEVPANLKPSFRIKLFKRKKSVYKSHFGDGICLI